MLQRLTGLDIVLVGGQALQRWCEEYADAPGLAGKVLTSKDVDFQAATQDEVFKAAKLLNGQAQLAGPDAWPMLGCVEFDAPDGQGSAKVDFLIEPTGLTSRAVAEAAIPFVAEDITVSVMHPLHCLVSRVENVVQAPKKYDTEHGIAQLDAAIVCEREFILRLVAAENMSAAVEQAKQVYEFCLERSCVKLWARKKIDVFSAIPEAGLPAKFYKRQPRMLQELNRARSG